MSGRTAAIPSGYCTPPKAPKKVAPHFSPIGRECGAFFPSSETTITGNPVFQKNCTKCHGKTAEGRTFGGPSLVSDKVTATSADELRTIITNGKHHMPKYAGKLTPEEIDTLVQQIKASIKK